MIYGFLHVSRFSGCVVLRRIFTTELILSCMPYCLCWVYLAQSYWRHFTRWSSRNIKQTWPLLIIHVPNIYDPHTDCLRRCQAARLVMYIGYVLIVSGACVWVTGQVCVRKNKTQGRVLFACNRRLIWTYEVKLDTFLKRTKQASNKCGGR